MRKKKKEMKKKKKEMRKRADHKLLIF